MHPRVFEHLAIKLFPKIKQQQQQQEEEEEEEEQQQQKINMWLFVDPSPKLNAQQASGDVAQMDSRL